MHRPSLGLLAACIAFGCGGSNGQERLGRTDEALETRIFASDAVELEPAIVNVPPSGVFATASFGTSHMLVMQAHTRHAGGYAPSAYVVHDGQVANPTGTDFTTSPTSGSNKRLALGTGTHWLYAQSEDLLVFNIDGSLKVLESLPFDAHEMAWGGDRALVVGASQGMFLDDRGQPLGDPFDVTPAPTLRNGGLAFDGSNFLLEYSTVEGVFAISISPTGSVGSPVTLRAVAGQPYDYGHGHSVVTDGQGKFLVLYDDFVNNQHVTRYRVATVDGSLGVALGAEQTAGGINPGVGSVHFLGGRYVFIDTYSKRALYVNRDGAAQGSYFGWTPWTNPTTYDLTTSADGASAVVVDFSGRVSRITASLGIVDNPRLQIGLGPNALGGASATFDGSKFWVSWSDEGRSAVRGAKVDVDGSTLASGPTTVTSLSGAIQPNSMISNGSSVFQFFYSTKRAVLTNSDETSVPIELPMAGTSAGTPSLATDGENYLLVGRTDTGSNAVLVSSTGTVVGSVDLPSAAWVTATFDGENYLVAYSTRGGAAATSIYIVPVSPDLTVGTPKLLITVPAESAARQALVSNGEQSLLVWAAMEDPVTWRVYCSRVSRDLELLDAPGVLLGAGAEATYPEVIWDGTYYWTVWPEQWAYRGLIQLVSPEPVNGSIVLEETPFIVPGPPIGSFAKLVAQPDGPVLFAVTPYIYGSMRTMLLSAREVRTELPMLNEWNREAIASDLRATPRFPFER